MTPASTLTFTDLNEQCGRSIIIFVLCSVYCSIDSAVQAEFKRSHENKEKLNKKRTTMDRCGQYLKEFLAYVGVRALLYIYNRPCLTREHRYTAEFVCTIIISILSIGEVHGVAVVLLFISLLWVMTPRTELKTSVQPKTVPTNWKGVMYRFSALFGTLLVCIQSLSKLEIVSEQLCPVVNETNRLNHSGVFGTYVRFITRSTQSAQS